MDAWVCFFCIFKLHWKPSEYINMSSREKLILTSMLEVYLEQEKEQRRKLNSSAHTTRKSLPRG